MRLCHGFSSSTSPVHLEARMSESRRVVNKSLDMNDLVVHVTEFAAVCEMVSLGQWKTRELGLHLSRLSL